MNLWFKDLSGNGQVVVGQTFNSEQAFRLDWVTNELSLASGEFASFRPEATNRRGDITVGNDWASFNAPVQQTAAEDAVRILGLDLGFWAYGISDDGTTVAASNPAGSVLLRGEEVIDVPAELRAISGNGEVGGGFRAVGDLEKRAVVWRDGEVFELPDAREGTPTEVLAVNADGTVAVGSALRFDGPGYEQQPFLWTELEGTTFLNGAGTDSYATDCDSNGETVVGITWTSRRDGAFIHTKSLGTVPLRQFLEGTGLPLPETLHLESGMPVSISNDGSRIAGSGFMTTESGEEQAILWHLTLGPDATRPR